MALILQAEQIQAMRRQAEAAYPEECCGLLLGIQDRHSDRRWVYEHRPLQNEWTDQVIAMPGRGSQEQPASKRNRYWIEPRDLLAAQRYCRDRGWIVLGVYHSHPDHPAVPSERDRQLAWTGYSYPILAIAQGRLVDLQSWQLGDNQQFYAEDLVTQETDGSSSHS
jgi:proteasome lid subunit RPN8/RPN11